jgi:hypothetical protein
MIDENEMSAEEGKSVRSSLTAPCGCDAISLWSRDIALVASAFSAMLILRYDASVPDDGRSVLATLMPPQL